MWSAESLAGWICPWCTSLRDRPSDSSFCSLIEVDRSMETWLEVGGEGFDDPVKVPVGEAW